MADKNEIFSKWPSTKSDSVKKIIEQASQSERFIDLAKQVDADESEDAFDAKLKRIAPKAKIQHASDCAVHNAPAMKPGRCTCGATRGQ